MNWWASKRVKQLPGCTGRAQLIPLWPGCCWPWAVLSGGLQSDRSRRQREVLWKRWASLWPLSGCTMNVKEGEVKAWTQAPPQDGVVLLGSLIYLWAQISCPVTSTYQLCRRYTRQRQSQEHFSKCSGSCWCEPMDRPVLGCISLERLNLRMSSWIESGPYWKYLLSWLWDCGTNPLLGSKATSSRPSTARLCKPAHINPYLITEVIASPAAACSGQRNAVWPLEFYKNDISNMQAQGKNNISCIFSSTLNYRILKHSRTVR